MWWRGRLGKCCRGCLGWSEGIPEGCWLGWRSRGNSHPFRRKKRKGWGTERVSEPAKTPVEKNRFIGCRLLEALAEFRALRLRGRGGRAWELRSNPGRGRCDGLRPARGAVFEAWRALVFPPLFPVWATSLTQIARVDLSPIDAAIRLLGPSSYARRTIRCAGLISRERFSAT